jgi:hypothetical protein
MSQRSALSFSCFCPSPLPDLRFGEARQSASYDVEQVVQVRGPELTGIQPGQRWWRIESSGSPAIPDAPFIGSSQHLVYTDAAEKSELVRISSATSGPYAVLIPICKSGAWWSLAQDERQAYLSGGARAGHIALGRPFAARIYRRLYHARYLPNSAWDFLTYFEFPEDSVGTFRELLSLLRDPERNPEWGFVEREGEIWMRLRERPMPKD